MKTFSAILLVISLVGCSPTIQFVPVYQAAECAASHVPIYKNLDESVHIGDQEYARVLGLNLIIKETYIHELENEVDCYRKQVPSEASKK